jgi:hypothetical protein
MDINNDKLLKNHMEKKRKEKKRVVRERDFAYFGTLPYITLI